MLFSVFWLQFAAILFVSTSLFFFGQWWRVRKRNINYQQLLERSPAAELVINLQNKQLLCCNRSAVDLLQLASRNSDSSEWCFSDDAQLLSLIELIEQKQLNSRLNGEYWHLHIADIANALLVFAEQGSTRDVWTLHIYQHNQAYQRQHKVKKERKLFADVLNSIPEFIYFKDADGHLLGCNQAWSNLLGVRPDQLHGKSMKDLLTAEEVERTRRFDSDVLAGKLGKETEWCSDSDGQQILLQNNFYPLRNPKGKVSGVLNVSYDVTKWHDLNRQLEQENQNRLSSERSLGRQNNLIRTVLNSTPDPLGFFDENGKVIGGNEPFSKFFGLSRNEVLGKHLQDFVAPDQLELHLSQNAQVFSSGEPLRYEELVWLETGEQIWYEVIKAPYQDDDSGECGIIFITRDVTERKNTEQQLADAIMQLQELSFIDSLTQVANRRSFDEKLTQHWVTHRREQVPLSLLLLDIDSFKQYNDNYGHQMGDEALRQVAKSLSASVKRGADLVARYGGEEFAVLLPNTDVQGALQIAERVLASFQAAGIPHQFSDVADYITASIGVVSIVPEQEQDYGDLVKLADEALYAAKHAGKARYSLASTDPIYFDAVKNVISAS